MLKNVGFSMKIAPLSHASSLFGSVRLGLYDLMFNKHIICGYTFCRPLSETVHLYYCAAFTIDPPTPPPYVLIGQLN